MMKYILLLICVTISFYGCNTDAVDAKNGGYTDGETTLFTKVPSSTSQILFQNDMKQTVDFNFMNYMYIYTGAGVAVGDINNDGLEDIYFVGNLGPNKLYLNKGNLQFEDITVASKTQDYLGFSTGVLMVDINNDGWLDIYVCKAGSLNDDDARRNLLFVNQQDGTFKEDAKTWGLDDFGYTTMAYSLDYDKDGDLDLYLVNHRYDFENNATISGEIQSRIEEVTSDQLYRNDGDKFTKVTKEAGLYNKTWGLSAVISDFNNDGWEDIYVANDFLEPDILYINQQDGTFKNEILKRMNHISTYSMGSDMADLNNDLFPDLITVDMLSENYARSKENMATMSTSNFETMVAVGYHHAYMANMLHYNLGNGKFMETSQMSGISKTDWSWAPLIADFDNDGHKDLFVSNGVDRDYTNQDARKKLNELMKSGTAMQLDSLLEMIPSEKLDNYIFKNNGDLTFTKMITEWGLNDPSYSNGAAYADLDNDGDLDLITNNLHAPAGIYRNNANNNYLQVSLKGPATNPLGIGAKVYVKTAENSQYQEQYLARGYESSVSKILHFGLGANIEVHEAVVIWPDGKTSKIDKPMANKRLTVTYSEATNNKVEFAAYHSEKKNIDLAQLGINYSHTENKINDYDFQLLIPQKQSTKGTGIITADVNGDGLDDFFVGNAAGAAAAMYIQTPDGKFVETNKSLWSSEAKYEDANALFFDADGDNDLDLYVVSAGYELAENSPLLQDRIYINDGKGNFTKSNLLPKMLVSGKSVVAGDYDNDGDLDLFVGGNVIPKKYPVSPRSYLLKNENGKFIDATPSNPILEKIGMVSEAIFTDYDGDCDLDLMVVGEWMAPTIYTNTDGSFTKAENISGLEDAQGWWFSVNAADFDGDGDLDYVMGNIGKNNKFQPKKDKPIYIYGKDFDNNGSFDVALSKINEGKLVPVRGKECSSQQNPFLLDKIATFKEFASLDMNDIYGEDQLNDAYQLVVHSFETVYVENLGNGKFKMHKLANEAQTGPTLSTIIDDFNGDGHLDILGVGAIYDAEVETIRYDGNYGYVLLGDGNNGFSYARKYDPFIDSDAKDITAIKLNGKTHYMVVSNNAPLELFTFQP